MAYGDIGSVIDTLEFDPVNGYYPDMVHISGDVYAIAYQGVDDDGWLVTVTIETDGQIGAAVIDSFEFDDVLGNYPVIIHVSGDVYAIAYMGVDSDGWLKTVTIETDGQIGAAVVDSLEFDADYCEYPDIIRIDGGIFAIAYTGGAADGWLVTMAIETDGQIGAAVIDSFEFAPVNGKRVSIIHVDGDVFAIAYQGADYDGWLVTVTIEADGQIGAAVIDSFEFDDVVCDYPNIIHVDGDVFAIAYQGDGTDGWLKTVTIEADGQIGAAVIDSLEFDAVACSFPDMVHVSGNIYAIAYQGVDIDGFLKTVTIETDGTIGAAELDSFEFATEDGISPSILHASGNIYAIAYRDENTDGWVLTLDISTEPAGGPHHEMIMGIGP